MNLPIGFAIAGVTFASLVHHVPTPKDSPLAGADPNAIADHGFTPLDWATPGDVPEVVQALLARSANPRTTTGAGALTFTVNGCDPEVVRANHAAASDLRVNDHFMCLLARMTARLHGRRDVLALLRNRGQS